MDAAIVCVPGQAPIGWVLPLDDSAHALGTSGGLAAPPIQHEGDETDQQKDDDRENCRQDSSWNKQPWESGNHPGEVMINMHKL